MIPGFNTDFKYRGETYHVQTEDNGVNNPVVVTLLYFKGAILSSRRTSYRDLLGTPSFQKDLMELMKSQHKELMRELLAGKFDKNLEGGVPAAARATTPAPVKPAPAAPRPEVSAAVTAPAKVTAAPAAIAPPAAPPERLSLDQAIYRYLEEYAAAAARGAAAIR